MRYILIMLLAILFVPATVKGQADNPFAEIPVTNIGLKTPDEEVKDAIVFLESKVDPQDKPYIRFFTTYAIPEKERDKVLLTLSFIVHSLTGITNNPDEGNAGSYYPIATKNKDGSIKYHRRVTNTLHWIDIREYNWTEQAWELMSSVDGYFVEPIVQHSNNSVLRLLAGNAIVRADWFIVHASDLTRQSDQNVQVPIYYTLLYAQNKIPKNIQDFRATWGLADINKSRFIGNEHGAIVTKSRAVALHNRALFHYRTELGWFYETYDVKNQTGFRDYVESLKIKDKGLPPSVSDAGEAFASNQVHMQVYTLRNAIENGKGGAVIDFADPSVARHMTDVLGDARVRTAHSCYDCHSAGPLPPENTLKEFLAKRGKLYFPAKKDSLRVERVYLSNKFEDSVYETQLLYAKAMAKINGLTPDENGKNYLDIIEWYQQPVTIEQAAYECGLTPKTFTAKLAGWVDDNGINRIHGRLALLVSNTEPVPRDIWETRGKDGIPGAFQQAMIMIHGLTQITNEIKYEDVYTVVSDRCIIYRGKDKLKLSKGEKLAPGTHQPNFTNGSSWVSVIKDGQEWWAEKNHVTKRVISNE